MLAIYVLSLLNFLIRIPFFNLPLHHDEIPYFKGILAVLHNHFNPFIRFPGYKPPVFYEIGALFFNFSKFYRINARLLAAVFSSLSLFFTYLLGKKIFSSRTGFFASLLLFFFPLFMGQSFHYQSQIIIIFLSLATLFYYFDNKKTLYFIFATFLVLTHETAIFIPFLIFLFNIIKVKGFLLSRIKKSVFFIFPLSFFFIWLVLNKIYMGWFF